MISPIAHRPVYSPAPLRFGHSATALPDATTVKFGHGPGHTHANGQTCTDKHCTEGQKGERQFCLQAWFDKVKAFFGKIKNFFWELFGKSTPQASPPAAPTEQKAAPTNPAHPPAVSNQSADTAHPHPTHPPQANPHQAHEPHKHGQDCCGGKHGHKHDHATGEKAHAHQ